MVIGYATGVFDLFHIGHVNLLRNARAICDKLIVGVSTDDLVFSYKGKKPVIPYHERVEVVRACRYVDVVIGQEQKDKWEAWKKIRFDALFVGDDWYEEETWRDLEDRLKAVDTRVVYFPYTKGTSSTLINEVLENLRSGGMPA